METLPSPIHGVRELKLRNIFNSKHGNYTSLLQEIQRIQSSVLNVAGPVVTIGTETELDSEQKSVIRRAIEMFCPWRKGPYRLFGVEIDSEWRSDLKWARLQPFVGSMEGATIADIGCHNGYFMFRMAAGNPERVVGFEPVAKNYFNFLMLQQFAQINCLDIEPLGVEHIDQYPLKFDKIFCLGILYHHTDPVGILRKMKDALNPGGTVFIDCQTIPGDEPVAWIPKSTFAGAKGVWAVPTRSCLETWVRRAGFGQLECLYEAKLSIEEQRSTPLARVRSLKDFLVPTDDSRTIEGYPAPWRVYLKVRK